MSVHYSAIFGAGDKVGERDNKLENLVCHFTKLGGHKMLWFKIWELVTKLD